MAYLIIWKRKKKAYSFINHEFKGSEIKGGRFTAKNKRF